MKEDKPSPDRKMITLEVFDNLFPHYDIFAKRSRMTTVITFSRENDAGSRARNTWHSFVLIVVLVLESIGLCCRCLPPTNPPYKEG